jgi:signal transduction histidine kinase/CheY-like chemotaxis protein
MLFKRLKEKNQKKISNFILSLPLFIFLLGVLITTVLAILFHQSEVRHKDENLKSSIREFLKIQNLMLNNSILRIESFNEISNLVRSKNTLEQNIVTEIVSSTLFQRASLFSLIHKKMSDSLPDLKFIRRFKTPTDNLPISNMPKMQSPYYRKKIKVMIDNHLSNIVALSHNGDATTIALIRRTFDNQNDFILYSSSLDVFFKDWPQDQNLIALLQDQQAGLEVLVKQDPKNSTFKFILDKNIIADVVRNNKFLIFSQSLLNKNSGISIKWYHGYQNNPSYFVLVIIIFGLTVTLLTSLLIRSILDQNRRIYNLVVSRTSDLQLAVNQAQEANLAKTRFLANMSHELRTPLNLILGMIELLQLGKLEPKNQSYLKTMQSAGDHLLGLITDLLSISKEDASEVKLNKATIRIPLFFEEIGTIIGSECLKKSLTFNMDISHSLPTSLMGDPVKLRQILLNLLRNSLKFTHTGGLTLSVSLNNKEIHQKTMCPIHFQVSDTGVGIAKKKINQIFERFFQIEASKMLADGGVGLGLSIVKDLVTKMNGHITVESELGEGSSFSVDLDLESHEDVAWINQYQLTQLPAKRCIGLLISKIKKNENVKNLLPSSVFETFEINLETKSSIVPDAIITDFIDDATIDKIKLLYPSIKLIILTTDIEFKNIKESANLSLVNNTPILYSQLFDSLDFKFKRNTAVVAVRNADLLLALEPKFKKNKFSILAVDDDAGNRELLKAYLENPQFNVSFAVDGREALEKFKDNKPDLVIADLRMPHMNGFELATAIYNHESTENVIEPKTRTPFILLTADALESTSNEAKKYAITTCLTKPIRKKHLIQSIYDTMNKNLS